PVPISRITTWRLSHARDRATQAQSTSRNVCELAHHLGNHPGDVTHPLLATRPTVKKVMLLVITSNRGFAGGYNGSILREAMHEIRRLNEVGTPHEVEVSGKKGITFLRFQGVPRAKEYTHFEDKS